MQNQRYIQHELTWSPTALVSYTVDSTFELKLTLNDSNTSALGPGTYLDPNSTFATSNLPDPYGYTDSPWHTPYEKYFIGGSTTPISLTANTVYFLQFTSLQPGQATQDNAELTISHSKAQCWFPFGCTSGAYCIIHSSRFGLEPIPGRIDWQPVSERCAEWSALFLPLLRQ